MLDILYNIVYYNNCNKEVTNMKTFLTIILAIVGISFSPMFIWGLSGILRLQFGFIYMFMLGFSACVECGVICAIKLLNKGN